MALAILLKESVKQFYGAEAQPFPALFPQDTFDARRRGGLGAGHDATSPSRWRSSSALTLFLNRTRTGRCMQATAQNPGVAEILGVNTQRMVLYTFLINAALAALASFLISPFYLAKFSNGETLGLVAFIAAIVGGFNQIRGALAGGLLIGVLDNLTATYVTAEYRAALPLVLLIVDHPACARRACSAPRRGGRSDARVLRPLLLLARAGGADRSRRSDTATTSSTCCARG